MISDTLKFIFTFDPDARPQTVPYTSFKNVDGLKKPSLRLAQRQWKQLSRRRFLSKLTANNKKEYFLSEEEKKEIEDRQKNHNRKVEEDETFDTLSTKYDLSKLDEAIAGKDQWNEEDIEEDFGETMEQRYLRKKEKVIDDLYGQYDFDARHATKILTQIGQDITCTFKSLLYINCVFLATQKNWIAFFLNPGCLLLSKIIFNEINIDNFYFVNSKGKYSLLKYYILYIQKLYFIKLKLIIFSD